MEEKIKRKIELFIGSDNNTHKLTQEYINKVVGILNKYFLGFTLEIGLIGYWGGIGEESIKVLIFSDSDINLNPIITELKQELKQKSILINIEKSEYQEG